jgi:V/A-type H+-transporting ATPase subunit I
MILPMARVRILGPRALLDPVLSVLQDAGVVHLSDPHPTELLRPLEPSQGEIRQARHLKRLVRELDLVAPGAGARVARSGPPERGRAPPEFARWARATGKIQRQVASLDRRARELEEERAEIARFQQFVAAFRGMVPRGTGARARTYHLILRGEDLQAVERLRAALGEVLREEFTLETAPLASGELAALLVVPAGAAPRVERLLAQSGVHELPLPSGIAGGSLVDALPALGARREAIDGELAGLARTRAATLAEHQAELGAARVAAADRLLELAARERAAATPRGFVVEGWVPVAARQRVARLLAERAGPSVVVEEVAREQWRGDEAPVVLSNPRLFRPFEAVTRMLPLPKYGSIDPTPFTAVFFPMFFGLILGDIGYGAVLGGLAAVLHRRSAAGSARRSIAEILGPCAAFSIAFGVAFGELFGDLGHRWFGLAPLVLNREKALLPFLGLAVAIGFVHVVLGLGLGVVNAARGHPRQAVGRGAALVMVVLVVVALLAAIEVVPRGLLTPAVIAILAAFPVLVIAEGIIAPIELLSTLSNVLSYARIMALGTASVMMAVVANRLAGSFGGVLVGVLFALLFHLVNFALGVFAPTIHGLRLHYVEFFGKFYSPGGTRYAPFGHWRPDEAPST